MKKEYITPALNVMTITTGNIIMTSTLGKYDTSVDASSALSKRGQILDDLDEE